MANKVITEHVGPRKDPGKQAKAQWWTEQDDALHASVQGVTNAIKDNQTYRRIQNLKYARLYSNYEMLGLSANVYSRSSSSQITKDRVTLNVIKSCVDTVCAKISKNKPKPLFLTEGGNNSLQRKAQQLTKYLEGNFYQMDVYEKAKSVFRDGCVFGLGVLKIMVVNGQVVTERVLPDEMIVDDAEGVYGKPRQIHQEKYVDRQMMIHTYPKHKNQIEAAPVANLDDNATYKSAADHIRVIESWHLPSDMEAKDGKHTISIQGATLMSERYEKDYFPFVFFRWSEQLVGFWGQGLAEELIGIQMEINRILLNIQIAQKRIAVPRVFVANNSKIISAHLDNDIGSIVRTSGEAPKFDTPQAMTPEVYNHLESLYRKAYEITGISLLSATSQKPSGLDAGVALREYQDIESERFIIIGQRYEKFFMDLSRIIIDMSADLYKDNPDLSVKVPGKKFIENIKWKEINLKDEQYTMKVWPVSMLPSTPAGKLQKIQELLQSGLIDQETGMSLLDFPDLESVTELKTAAIDDVKMVLEEIVEKGNYIPPEPYMNLELALKMAQSTYLRSKVSKVPEDRMDMLRLFMEDIQNLLAPPVPEPVPGQMDPQMGAPMPGQAPITDQVIAESGEGQPLPEEIQAIMNQEALAGQPIATPAPAPETELLPYKGQ